MDNQQQGNGWVGGSLGALAGGVAGQYLGYPASRSFSTDFLWKEANTYKEQTIAHARNTGIPAPDRQKMHYENLDDEAFNNARKLRNAASLFVKLGLPITAGLLGSTLTD